MPLSIAKRLKDSAGLQQLVEESADKPVIIFKHSATCPISAAAWAQFQKLLTHNDGPFANNNDQGAVAAYLIVQEDRPISNEIAEMFNVRHESPQALVLRHGQVTWHNSHGALTADSMGSAIRSAQ